MARAERAREVAVEGDLASSSYAGLVTRAIAFAVDAAIVNLSGIAVGVVVGLALSVLDTPEDVDDALLAIGAALFMVWTIGYFVAFWSTTGETPGNRVMLIRVQRPDGALLRPRTAFVRFAGVILAAIPLLVGFLPILVDRRRRGFHDVLARSVVVHVTPELDPSVAPAGRRAAARQR